MNKPNVDLHVKRLEKIKEMLAEGKKLNEIALKLKITLNYTQQICRINNIDYPKSVNNIAKNRTERQSIGFSDPLPPFHPISASILPKLESFEIPL